jgi:hypothetical protein
LTGGSVKAPIGLHVPSPPSQQEQWRDAVLAGADLVDVVTGDDGIADWLWRRWRALERAGLDREAFVSLVVGYRRELWLWLGGERPWAQCCAGLIGRIERRLPG